MASRDTDAEAPAGASVTPRRSARISEIAAKEAASNTTPGPVTTPLKRKRAAAQTKAVNSRTTKNGTKTSKGRASTRGKSTAAKIRANLNKRKSAITKNKAATKTLKIGAASSKQNHKYQVPKAKDNAPQELPHNLGLVPGSLAAKTGLVPALESNDSDKENQTPKDEDVSSADIQVVVDTVVTTADDQKTPDPATKSAKAKRPAYRLTPGKTPYPDLHRPTRQECEEVNRLLVEVHGEAKPPPKLEPSLSIAGCGEVPCVLDALIRTLLSGATSGNNSAMAFDGLVKRFGILQEGLGKGSVNWDAVRQAPLKDVFEAIKRGGLADIKSKNLKAILDKVYEENQEQRKRIQSNDGSFDEKHPDMAPEKAEQAKEYEVACAEQHVLSLNHLHNLPTEDVMNELTKYPGIGPKTAACVILFCLQRPCFAVDTHIFRICKWLGWIPEKANEIMAFKHLDATIPDEFKYSLHQLFIRHGKTCPRCRAITGEKTAGWEEGCPIDNLVKRTGGRKGGPPQKAKRPRKSLKRKRSATTKTKSMKQKATGKKAASAKKTPACKIRARKQSTSSDTTALENSSPTAAAVDDTAADVKSSEIASSPPVANQGDITIPATPATKKNGVSNSSASENNVQAPTQAAAAEETDSETSSLSDADVSYDDLSEEEVEDETANEDE